MEPTNYRKGIRLIFLNQSLHTFECGNTNEPRDASGGPEKSSLFFLTAETIMTLESDYLEIGLNGW